MEKIRITADDIARAESPLPFTTPAIPGNLSNARLMQKPWRIIAVGVATVVVLALALVFTLYRGCDPTMVEWKDAQRQRMNAELASSPKLKPYIESIHPLVTFTGASLKTLSVKTVDGTERVGRGGSNIAEVEFVVTYHWEGPVQKNGYTEVLYVWDNQSNQLKYSRYLDTTATVNLDNIDWIEVGKALVPLLFGGN